MIKQILDNLHQEQKDQLMYAFEEGFTQVIIYEPGKFIGVNVSNVGNLIVENTEGVWSSGEIKK